LRNHLDNIASNSNIAKAISAREHLRSYYTLKIHDLRKKYGRLHALGGISFEVYPSEIFGFLGPNGAGKTTTIKCITTLTKPSSGSIEIFGINALSHPDQVRLNIGYVPQNLSLIGELSGYENLLIYSKLYDVPKQNRHENILRILELLGIRERGHDEVRKYSGGMMRRLKIGTAIVHNPSLIVLDEPPIGLDPQGRRTVWELLKRLVHDFGNAIFMTTHDMSEADELCDRIAIVNHGKIAVIDTPSNLKRSVAIGEEETEEGVLGRGENIVIIKTFSDPFIAISILESEMGIKAKIVVDQHG
jgi:ABC-2 type transport system ATP-binding protein